METVITVIHLGLWNYVELTLTLQKHSLYITKWPSTEAMSTYDLPHHQSGMLQYIHTLM